MIKGTLIPLGILLTIVLTGSVRGDDFFKGKTIDFVVAYSAGGSFDAYARLIARHIGKHIPGAPNTLVRNMTGAAGMLAANDLYHRAEPDGLTIGAFASPLILQHAMGNQAAQFDGRKFEWLGVPVPNHTVCSLRVDTGIKTVDDWYGYKQPVKIAAIGPGTSTSDVPKMIQVATGLPIDVIDGYRGGANARLAVESGEVNGYCGGWGTVRSIWRSALKEGKIRVVLQGTLKPHPELKDVPLALDHAKSEEGRRLLTVIDNSHRPQFPFSLSPGVPKDRVSILQKAFMDTLRDPAAVAEADKLKLEIEPIDADETKELITSPYELPNNMIAKLKAILVPKR
ncbi:MAG: tripartite tricarboxylate transporter substrate-binding protein [Deltaproteobacteria bacterium]|nr:tripartite tricarboxylate transporter substrate-binding protein [Deltaproteobacteria bacterium]